MGGYAFVGSKVVDKQEEVLGLLLLHYYFLGLFFCIFSPWDLGL